MTVRNQIPGSTIQKSAEYKGQFIFLIAPEDPDEFPIFVSVNRNTNELIDFLPWEEENPEEIQSLFQS
jgi:hypothetical protein